MHNDSENKLRVTFYNFVTVSGGSQPGQFQVCRGGFLSATAKGRKTAGNVWLSQQTNTVWVWHTKYYKVTMRREVIS